MKIGVFDTTVADRLPYNDRDWCEFVSGIQTLARAHPHVLFLFKEKNPDVHVSGDVPNVEYVHGYGLPTTSQVLKSADLAISMGFTSPTVEMWGAGRCGMFYDPTNKYPTSTYDRFPYTVAHNVVELKKYYKYWTTDPDMGIVDEIRRWLEVDKVDGISEFRRLLCNTTK